jgi:hypothetical protein
MKHEIVGVSFDALIEELRQAPQCRELSTTILRNVLVAGTVVAYYFQADEHNTLTDSVRLLTMQVQWNAEESLKDVGLTKDQQSAVFAAAAVIVARLVREKQKEFRDTSLPQPRLNSKDVN